MHISQPDLDLVCQEHSLYLPLIAPQAHILELGCGNADKARSILRTGKVAFYLALEADPVQHAKNQALTDLASVRFELGGAENIPAENNSFDLVLMFKSLHHVPLDQMDRALGEIQRVLKPGGLAYISEPVFAGDYNEILRLFHDEEQVRIAAFAAIERSVASGLLELVEEKFFKTEVRFRDFPQFEERVIGVTYQQHRLTPECLADVRSRFHSHLTPEGARFFTPNRLDLLRKPHAAAE